MFIKVDPIIFYLDQAHTLKHKFNFLSKIFNINNIIKIFYLYKLLIKF